MYMPKCIELYALNICNILYVNYTSIKPQVGREGEREERKEQRRKERERKQACKRGGKNYQG